MLANREGGKKESKRGREVAKFCQSCHLHSFASFRQIAGPRGQGNLPDAVAVVNNLLCAYWQNTCETVDREEIERGGQRFSALGTRESG